MASNHSEDRLYTRLQPGAGPPRKPETFLAAQGPPVASGGPFLQAQKPAKVLSPVSSSAHLPAIGRAAEKPVIPSAPFSAAYFAFWRWVLSEVAMVLLPTFCPACSGFTMKVVKYGLDDSYEARCTACGYNSFGKISPELLIVKGAVDSTPQKTSLGKALDFSPRLAQRGCTHPTRLPHGANSGVSANTWHCTR